MQANKITIGESYAVSARNDASYRAFRVTAMVQTKNSAGTSTEVKGVFEDGEGGEKVFAVSTLLGPVQEYADLMAERRVREAAQIAEKEQRKAQVALAAKLFSEATGIPLASGAIRDNKGIRIGYGGLEVSESYIPTLIEHFQKAKE